MKRASLTQGPLSQGPASRTNGAPWLAATDQIGRDLKAIALFKMGADVADTQPGGIEADDLVIHPVDPSLALLDQLRFEAAVPISRHRDGHRPFMTFEYLAGCNVTAIGLVCPAGASLPSS